MATLKQRKGLTLHEYDLEIDSGVLEEGLRQADVIFHLAGVNRPQTEEEFHTGNTGSTEELCRRLRELGRAPKIVLSSSIQAGLDNPYGMSKRKAEEVLRRFAEASGAECVVYRFKNLFGKWSRPNYNSVAATFCHNIANGLPIQISNPANEIELTHIDDVVDALVSELAFGKSGFKLAPSLVSKCITLGELAQKIQSFRDLRDSLVLPDFSQPFDKALYGTYLSYLQDNNFSYGLDIKTDSRGSLAEFLKSPEMGQIFVSRTNPGITRGDHYHHTKTEKFLVVEGEAVIRFRHIERNDILEYPVSGDKFQVVDIPPGYTHSIENVGDGVLVTLFWASEPFDPEKPDTYFEKV
jgi:UDP-2-acetamido-2,6-beta-L-arabino-hexul-4-ose reductase